MLAKKGASITIAPDPHGIDLLLGPFVKVGGPDEGQMNPHGPMGGAAVQADEDTMIDTHPGRAGVGAVKARLVVPDCLKLPELPVLVC